MRTAAPLLLVLVDVQDPGNLGALARVAEAAGSGGLVICGDSASPYSWRALRGSMGSLLRMPVLLRDSAETALADLRTAGFHTIAAAPRGGRLPDRVQWAGSVALFMGGEGPGLPDPLLTSTDETVTIPMTPPVESLNVSVAGAILLYAAQRHRS
jgi:TrmH family RNA methyltransferase